MEKLLFDKKEIRINIYVANGAILSDMSFDWSVGSGMFMIGRLPGILAHVNKEKTRESPFRKFFEIGEWKRTIHLKSINFNFKLI